MDTTDARWLFIHPLYSRCSVNINVFSSFDEPDSLLGLEYSMILPCLKPNSEHKPFHQISSLATSFSVMYSVLVVDNETNDCNQNFYEVLFPPI